MGKLALYDLLAPQFLLGFSFPEYIDKNLRVLSIEELHTTYDSDLIVYSGTLMFDGSGSGGPYFEQTNPSGISMTWNGNQFKFRLTVSRDASELIHESIDSLTAGSLDELNTLFNALRPSDELTGNPVSHPHTDTGRDETITDYPGFAFKLELLLDVLNFSLGVDWIPGKIDPVSRHVVPDTSPQYANKQVRIILPKVVLQYEQGQDLSEDPEFSVQSWGGAGIDTPNDLQVGEFIRMDPGIALHWGGNVAFSIDRIILDNSEETTPPEILNHFGTSEDFKGVYCGQMLLFIKNNEGVGFNFRVSDALISYDGEVSLEGALDVFLRTEMTWLSVDVKIYTGAKLQEYKGGEIDPPAIPPTVTNPTSPPGKATVTVDSVLQVEISGGTPPYSVQVFRDTSDVWDASSRQAVLDTVGEKQKYLVYVEDSHEDERKYAEYLSITVQPEENKSPSGGTGTSSDQPSDPRRRAAVLAAVTDGDSQHTIRHEDAGSGTVETIEIPGIQPAEVKVARTGGLPPLTVTLTESNRSVSFNLPHGEIYGIQVRYSAGPLPKGEMVVTFTMDQPYCPDENSVCAELKSYLDDVENINLNESDPQNPVIRIPSDDHSISKDTQFLSEIVQLTDWVRSKNQIDSIEVDGFASKNSASQTHDKILSANRAEVGKQILLKLGFPSGKITTDGTHGHENYDGSNSTNDPERHHRAARMRARFNDVNVPEKIISSTISRPALPPVETEERPDADPVPTPSAPPMPNSMPTVLRRLGARIRLERNQVVLLELSGEIDFETAMEEKLRTTSGLTSDTDRIEMSNGAGNSNDKDGVVDFKVVYTYNTATSERGIGLTLGSHPEDSDGLLHMNNAGGASLFKNIFGSLLVFAPIINSTAVSTANDSENAGNWVALGTSVAVPVTIGGLNIFRTRRAVLYGGEVKVKFSQPDPAVPQTMDLGIVFDYGVEFDIVIESLGIGMDRNVPNPSVPPLKVRYKAIGFNLHYDETVGGMTYSPVFDASRGYDLQLSDPSLFSLPEPLGNLFGVSAARLARFNPLTLEIDLAIKVDLGIITVDKFKIKIPLEEDGSVQILPSGVKVNIPGTLIGNGFVNIVDTMVTQADGSQIEAKGIEGGLDLTIVSVKLRVAGNVGVTQLSDAETGRDGVGVFVSMTVEFPSPIVLGASGLGLYGMMGLFAMHYRRLEDDSIDPTDPIGPALDWLIKAEGDPTKLRNSSNTALWGPNFDRWSFGVGVILGTLDTGFTANFQGMFVLELPGPRILIMVKMKFVSAKPEGVDADHTEITTGIIAVIDIDFDQEKITIGVLIDFEIEEVLQLKVPIEILFKLKDPSHWHFWLGTFTVPVSASILNMVRGSAYFMIQGHKLTFPGALSNVPPEAPILNLTLDPVAIALGLEASLIFGSESAGLYLKIGAGFHVGLSFSPFVIAGSMFFAGELRLFIVSIGARGNFDVLITKKEGEPFYVYLHGKICGKVDFFFFSVSACIEVTIEEGNKLIDPPALISGVYLQSYAPVLLSGQGGDKPIDASLGNAIAAVTTNDLPVVPIDTVLVIQMSFSPLTESTSTVFAKPLDASPDLRSPGGWINLSKETKVKYELTEIRLNENGGAAYSDAELVPATWRVERNSGETLSNGARTNVDLALFSRVPTTADRALERSSDLERQIEVRWGNVCEPAAPPASVLFTFCGQLLGPSPDGWDLNGIAKPDPPDTQRISPPNTTMHVEDYHLNGATAWEQMVRQFGVPYKVDSRVVGGKGLQIEDESHEPVCITIGRRKKAHYELMRHGIYFATGRKISDLKTSVFEEARIQDKVERDNRRLRILTDRPLSRLNKREFLLSGSKFKIPVLFSEHMPIELPSAWEKPIADNSSKIDRINRSEGVILEPKMAIHFRKPVCKVEITIVAYSRRGKVAFTAYNNKKKAVSMSTLKMNIRKTGSPILVTLTGEDIVSIAIKPGKVKGVITKICYHTNCKDEKPMTGKCHKALQLPYCNMLTDKVAWDLLNEDERLREALKKHGREHDCNAFLDLETGACEEILFLAALSRRNLDNITVQELNSAGNVLDEHSLSDLSPQLVSNILTDLPSDWLDASLPWRANVIPVTQFLFSSRFTSYQKYVFKLSPENECVKIRFSTQKVRISEPPMYLGIVERLQSSEVQHHETVTASGMGSLETLEGYLSHAEGDRPLLKKDTVYHLHMEYDATVVTKDASGSETIDTTSHTQSFSFQTDNEAPPELKPYILGSTPAQETEYHFFRDPLKVVFNDISTLELYKTYGKDLKGVIRGADGEQVINSPNQITSLDPVPASVLTPYREFVENLLDEGLLDCTGGIVRLNNHGVYESPFELKPLMGYTFDIELDPADTLEDGESRVPLFRRSFKTSKFADLEDFANSIATLPVYSMALSSSLMGLPPTGPVSGTSRNDIAIISDIDLQVALENAGVPPSAGAEDTGIWILWDQTTGQFKPEAILIDASEPMWRLRSEPVKSQVRDGAGNVIDEQFEIWEEGEKISLELLEDSGLVDYYIRSAGGTRCLIMLNTASLSSTDSTPLTLDIRQSASDFYGLPEKTETLIAITLDVNPPWED